jgi:hypothetical protein
MLASNSTIKQWRGTAFSVRTAELWFDGFFGSVFKELMLSLYNQFEQSGGASACRTDALVTGSYISCSGNVEETSVEQMT